MTWVKVCGMRTEQDVAVAVEAGADAVGFVNVLGSPRFVSIPEAASLADGVPVDAVLLTQDEDPNTVLEILETSSLTAVQPYGARREAVAQAALQAGHKVYFPVRAASGLDLTTLPGVPLIDTPSSTQFGGTGRVFDWTMVADLTDRFVLAGGLGPDNVRAAIAVASPWGVDASSGLERASGVKDHGMVADFITKAKMI
ncbi:MAG: phosphoribosylanthranilate isomerase [Acidimicrobiia bacterium]|nr:phosphoribosylanthranilate isomerase [Acidimicrobiia bacterium]